MVIEGLLRVVARLGGGAGSPTHAPARVQTLDRLRTWPADRPLIDTPSNGEQTRALTVLTDHLNAAFVDSTGAEPSDAELRDILAPIRISTHDFSDGGYSEREALTTLRTSVVVDTGRAGDAWNALCRASIRAAAGQAGLDLRSAQEILRRESIAIRAPRSYRDDIAALGAHTARTMRALEDLSDITLTRVGRRSRATSPPSSGTIAAIVASSAPPKSPDLAAASRELCTEEATPRGPLVPPVLAGVTKRMVIPDSSTNPGHGPLLIGGRRHFLYLPCRIAVVGRG